MTEERTPKNAPGPFYVVKDECISCGAPEAEARGLMSYDEENRSCFFVRQPASPEEEYRAIRAVWVSCCGAVRYGGTDPKVIRRLERLGVWSPPESRAGVALPSVVTFLAGPMDKAPDILRRVGARLIAFYANSSVSDVADAGKEGGSCRIIYSWPNDMPGAKLTLARAWDGDGRWAISIDVSVPLQLPAAALQLSDALERSRGLSDFRWYAGIRSSAWQPLPA